MQPTRFGTVRPKQAEILTAKLTAILSDIGAYQRPSADPSCCVFILRGYRWTLADPRTAVFKTAGSGAAPQGHRRVLSYSNAGGKRWHFTAHNGTQCIRNASFERAAAIC